MLKFKKKVNKEWDELTVEEKVNLLNAEREKPEIIGSYFFTIFIIFSLIAAVTTLSIFTNYRVDNIVNVQSINDTLTSKQSFSVALFGTWSDFLAYIAIFGGLFFVLYSLNRRVTWLRKWRPFLKSLQKDEEVRY